MWFYLHPHGLISQAQVSSWSANLSVTNNRFIRLCLPHYLYTLEGSTKAAAKGRPTAQSNARRSITLLHLFLLFHVFQTAAGIPPGRIPISLARTCPSFHLYKAIHKSITKAYNFSVSCRAAVHHRLDIGPHNGRQAHRARISSCVASSRLGRVLKSLPAKRRFISPWAVG